MRTRPVPPRARTAMPKLRVGVYPGTFDPVTNGHVDIIKRASRLVDRLVIGIASNAGKGPLFSIDERVGIVREVVADLCPAGRKERIDVQPFAQERRKSDHAKGRVQTVEDSEGRGPGGCGDVESRRPSPTHPVMPRLGPGTHELRGKGFTRRRGERGKKSSSPRSPRLRVTN